MHKRLTLLLGILLSLRLSAQKNVEAGILIGATNYIGDMTETRFQQMNMAGGLMIRYNPNHYISFRGNIFYGTINGDDNNFSNPEKRHRNLNFTSPLFEFSGQVEWNLFGYNALPGRSMKKGFSPYLFAGAGIFKFNPKSKDNSGQWVELQPLGTEGQGTTPLQDRKKYALTQFSIPLGVGIKFRLMPKINIGIEYGIRFTFTDYLDDVSLTYVNPQILTAAYGAKSAEMADRSNPAEDHGPYDIITAKGKQRGDNATRDYYAFTGVTLSYTISLQRVRCYQF